MAVSELDNFVSSTSNFNIITLEHMKKLKNNTFVANTGHFENEIDFAGSDGLDIKPQKITSSSPFATVHRWSSMRKGQHFTFRDHRPYTGTSNFCRCQGSRRYQRVWSREAAIQSFLEVDVLLELRTDSSILDSRHTATGDFIPSRPIFIL